MHNRNMVMQMLQRAWQFCAEMKIMSVGVNKFVVTIEKEEDKNRILREGPWNILGRVVLLQQWEPSMTIDEVSFKHLDVWVQAHGVPLKLLSEENAYRMAVKLGEPLEVENPYTDGNLRRPYLRFRLRWPLEKALKPGIWLPRKDREKKWVQLRYERLHHFCYGCGIIGHEQRECAHPRTTDSAEDHNKRMGPWMSVYPPVPLEKTIITNTSLESTRNMKQVKSRVLEQLSTQYSQLQIIKKQNASEETVREKQGKHSKERDCEAHKSKQNAVEGLREQLMLQNRKPIDEVNTQKQEDNNNRILLPETEGSPEREGQVKCKAGMAIDSGEENALKKAAKQVETDPREELFVGGKTNVTENDGLKRKARVSIK